jgi:hypothetical protein
MAFWTALRQWGERAIAAGILTIDDISGNPRSVHAPPDASPKGLGTVVEYHGRLWRLDGYRLIEITPEG